MRTNLARFAAHAAKFWGPKARKRAEGLKVAQNRAVRRLLRRAGSRAERIPPRVAGGYPGAIVLNARGKSMGPSGKETPEARRVRRARGIGMARPRVADRVRNR